MCIAVPGHPGPRARAVAAGAQPRRLQSGRLHGRRSARARDVYVSDSTRVCFSSIRSLQVHTELDEVSSCASRLSRCHRSASMRSRSPTSQHCTAPIVQVHWFTEHKCSSLPLLFVPLSQLQRSRRLLRPIAIVSVPLHVLITLFPVGHLITSMLLCQGIEITFKALL